MAPRVDDAPAPPVRQAPPRRGAPLPLAAAVAVLWAAVLSLVPLLLLAAAGASGTGASAVSVLRLGVGAWLLGHGVPVATPTDRITLVPLAITAWVAWRLARAGVHACRATGAHRVAQAWPAVRCGLAVAMLYASLGAVTAVAAGTADIEVSPGRAALAFGLLGGAAAVGGALGYGRSGRLFVRRLPRVLADAVRAAVAGVGFLLAAGAAVCGVVLALSGADAVAMLGAYDAGISGQVGITAICLAYLPNLAVWGAAYLVGPGFAVGTGTVVSPLDVLVGPVPALPVVAALPGPGGELSGAALLLLGLPFVAGLAAGGLLGRPIVSADHAGSPPPGAAPVLGAALLAGPLAALLVHLCAVASRGGLGSGRLAHLGPGDGRVAVLAGVVIGLGTLVGAVSRRALSR